MEIIEPTDPLDPTGTIDILNSRERARRAPLPQPSAQFAAILAPILAAQLQQAGLTGCMVSVASPGFHPAADDENTALSLCLHLEGALSGLCYFSIRLEQATRIAATAADVVPPADGATADAAAWWIPILQACCDPFAMALSAIYGTVHVHRAEDLPVPTEAAPIAHLLFSQDAAQSVAVTVFGEGALVHALERFDRVAAAAGPGMKDGNLGLVMDVELNVTLRFGQRQLSLREVMELASGSVVELDREVDEPVELILDGRVIARGEAVIVDGNYGVRVTEVLQPVVM